MFYYLNGKVAAIDLNLVVIDCGGVGFSVNTTTTTLSQLKKGETALLYTYCAIREDAFDIFGFATKRELEAYRLLTSVSDHDVTQNTADRKKEKTKRGHWIIAVQITGDFRRNRCR